MTRFSDPSDPRPPLPDWVQEAYQILADAADGQESDLTYEEAYALLNEANAFSAEHSDSEYAVERLLTRGYLYEANGTLRVTETVFE
ncbi:MULTISPECIES: hypothetical protein [Halarchaeum]|uniref:Uncharacterized protein n=2 Tax=Halarchaeum TaxID=744724 RepID=U2YY53_9EURY|nr:hypothetical protein [Halarchaeum acidiphilum]GAD53732.1 hypothetical protein MBEHAL_2492 [Halarchaeum acidiphilum MH1-52-1]